MPDVSLGVFERRKTAKLDPLLAFKWVCVQLPFGHDVTYCEEFGMTFPEVSPKEGLFGAGTYTYYPAFEDISAFDCTFYEDSELNTTKWINDWMLKIRNPDNGAYYLPTNYKFDLVFHLMDTTGKAIGECKMINCWPTGRGNWDLNYTSDDRLRVQQNFSVDSQEFKIF